MFKRIAIAALLCVTHLSMYGQAQEYGEKIVNTGTEVFFVGDATKADAEKLGEYLKDSEFSDGSHKSVQLVKEFGTWQFRMVTQAEFIDDPVMQGNFRFMCLELSNCFDGEDVDVHVCNDSLQTQKVVQGHQGKLTMIGKTQVYHSDITAAELAKIDAFLAEYGFKDQEGTFYVQKRDGKIKFRMVSNKPARRDQAVLADCKALAKVMSKSIFAGKVVEYHLCNEYLESENFVAAQADN